MLRSPMEKLRLLAPAKYDSAWPRAKNLVWALLVRTIFNDPKFQSDREQYGSSLAKERTFGDRLESLASSRIWPILREIFASPAYREKIELDRFDFLRTKEVYERSMDIAYAKWKWSKRSL